ncbi:AsmA protein [Nitrosospira multiformis]|uniref:AsmA protein n=1 Tax=Nitrosospira multiformis TaxID=1231 RepID=A0A1I0G1B5_9PROT|nr:AsmA family protein [Nitrosospira multiformis]SET64514.1 AsmA protein [Nitrosospira multiformis]
MNRYPHCTRWAFFLFAGLTVLLLGSIIYIVVIFDPNAYKPEIIRLVKEKKERLLRLDGPITLAFFPSPGLKLTGLSLSEHNSDEEFATIEKVHFSLEILPLLRKELVLDEINITGLKANLIRFSDGSTNIDDLIRSEEQRERFRFDIGRVHMEKTLLAFRDEGSDTHFVFRNIGLEADRADERADSEEDAIRSKVELAFNIAHPERAEVDITTRIRFHLTLNAERQYFALNGMKLAAEAQLPDTGRLLIQSSGNFSASFLEEGGEFGAEEFTFDAGIRNVDSSFNIGVNAIHLGLRGQKVTADKVLGVAQINRSHSLTRGKFSLSSIQGTLAEFRSEVLSADLESESEGRVIKAHFSSPVGGNIQALWLRLPELKAEIEAKGASLPANGIQGSFFGSASLDSSAGNAWTKLNGTLADSNITVIFSASGFIPPHLAFEADIDELNLDRFSARQQDGQQRQKASHPQRSFELSVLDDLEGLNLEGSIRVGVLKAGDFTASRVRVDIRP